MTVTLPTLEPTQTKDELVELLRAHLQVNGFEIAETDANRPWGAFLRIADAQADKFIDTYFAGQAVPENARHGERSPKFLLVAPYQRLSWQYHDRRAEYWRTLIGTVGVMTSPTDTPPSEVQELPTGATIALAQGTRHRLIGLDAWGVIAEIWIHTDPQHPSNEADNYRLQDDYART